MEKLLFKAFSFVFLFFCPFFSCGTGDVIEEFVQAENLMQTQPESALKLLESIPFPEKMSKADYAEYCLLLTEAQDKTYFRFTSDSLIQIALSYYEETGDRLKLPEVYYYMGRVCHALLNAPQAISYYLKARDALGKGKDYALEARIYNQLGSLYLTLRFNENALLSYRKAYESLSLAGDSLNLPYILRDIARTYHASDNIDSAVVYYNNAISLAVEVNNRFCEASSHAEVAGLFIRANNTEKAKEHIFKSADLSGNQGITPQALLILGKLYRETGQADSARYYFNRSMDTDNPYTHAASLWELSLLEEKERNYKQAVLYSHRYIAQRDSIEALMNKTAVSDMEHFYNYQQVENENNRLKMEYNRRLLLDSTLLFAVAIIFILIVACFLYYRQKKKKELLIKERDLLYKEEQYRKSQERIEENRQEIKLLKKALDKSNDPPDALPQEFIRVKKELLEQENKQIELSGHFVSLQKQKLLVSPAYKEIKGMALTGKLPQPVWQLFKDEMDAIYDVFENKLRLSYPAMSDLEIKVCYLIKAGFNVSEIAMLLSHAKSSISSCRKRLYGKITGKPGSPDDLDRLVASID